MPWSLLIGNLENINVENRLQYLYFFTVSTAEYMCRTANMNELCTDLQINVNDASGAVILFPVDVNNFSIEEKWSDNNGRIGMVRIKTENDANATSQVRLIVGYLFLIT